MSLAMISMRYFTLQKYLYNGQIPSLRRPFIGDIVVDYILIINNLYLKYLFINDINDVIFFANHKMLTNMLFFVSYATKKMKMTEQYLICTG